MFYIQQAIDYGYKLGQQISKLLLEKRRWRDDEDVEYYTLAAEMYDHTPADISMEPIEHFRTALGENTDSERRQVAVDWFSFGMNKAINDGWNQRGR